MATAEPRTGGAVVAPGAPVFSFAEMEIDAPIEVVWNVLTAFDRWPTWNPEVKSVSVDGPISEGMTFRWKAGPGTITSTVSRIDRPRLIAWNGKTLGIRANHVWHLAPRDGGTQVRTEETYHGLVARLLRRPLRKMLDRTLSDGVRSLKLESERRGARSSSSGPSEGSVG
jgi:uncharacterized protein YndB with AHSA1/START domain